MSMRNVFSRATICETLRDINDILNTENIDKVIAEKIRDKLRIAESMAKKITTRLYLYNKEYDSDWWEQNKDFDAKVKLRLNEKYIV